METILCQLLECGSFDVYYLDKLCQNNSIELDIEDIKWSYWSININCLIYEVLYQIAERFIAENQDELCKLLWVSSEQLEYDELYEIFTNCFDSHLWFKDDEIQELFEKSKYQV